MSADPSLPPRAEPASVPDTGAGPSFEAAMERLEVIVEQMENARLPLEELIRGYEEGTRLIRVCSERLSAAEQRIEIITRDAGGQPRVSEYSSPAATAATVPAPAPKAARESKPTPVSSPAAPAVSRLPSKTPNEVSLF
jgi:exodeoxyribonuclease VII small subunit